MKYVFCGDLHGEINHLKNMHQFAKSIGATLVTVGDYTDSFDRTRDEQLQVIQYLLNNRDIIPLIGNHDVHYMTQYMTSYACSGFDKYKYRMFHSTYNQLKDRLRFFFKVDNILATHAGLSNGYFVDLNKYDSETGEPLFNIDEFIEVQEESMQYEVWNKPFPNNRLYDVGYDSGGRAGCGGILWARPTENFVPIEGIIQIVGHTPMMEIGTNKNNSVYYIDTVNYGDKSFMVYDQEAKKLTIEKL